MQKVLEHKEKLEVSLAESVDANTLDQIRAIVAGVGVQGDQPRSDLL
jgi:hypothetical protein